MSGGEIQEPANTQTRAVPRPVVSIILPFWNAGQYLREAVTSVLTQTFKDFELLLLDDGSDDGSSEIVASFAADPRVIMLRFDHGGYSPLLNVGLREARGRYIARMDADDVCLPDRLAAQVAFLEDNADYVAVGGQVIKIDPDGDPLGNSRFPTDDASIRREYRLGRGVINHPSSMYTAEAGPRSVGGYRVSFEPGEDFDFFLRLSSAGKLANLSQSVLRYRLHQKNVTVVRAERHREVKQQAIAEAYERDGVL